MVGEDWVEDDSGLIRFDLKVKLAHIFISSLIISNLADNTQLQS